jgi:hypothetical protein
VLQYKNTKIVVGIKIYKTAIQPAPMILQAFSTNGLATLQFCWFLYPPLLCIAFLIELFGRSSPNPSPRTLKTLRTRTQRVCLFVCFSSSAQYGKSPKKRHFSRFFLIWPQNVKMLLLVSENFLND